LIPLSNHYAKNIKKQIEFDANPYLLNFRDGCFDIQKKIFRKREKQDYITKYIDREFNFKRDPETINMIKKKYFESLFGDNANEVLRFFGYSLTGNTAYYQNILFLIGPLASNGKTTLAEIFDICLPIYFFHLDSETFNKNYSYVHKQFVNILPPVRLCFMDELNRDALDVERLKQFCTGKLNINLMYRDSKAFSHQSKLLIASNNMPKFKNDSGIERRGLMIELNKRFLSDRDYERALALGEKILKMLLLI